jgi:ribosomal protein S18 acetylase RimI-like enzyme
MVQNRIEMIHYTLRKAEEKDFDITHTIKIDAMKDYITLTWGWDEELQNKFHREEFYRDNIYMVEVAGRPIGTIGINEVENEIVINRIYLLKEFQSKGIGSSLLKNIIKENNDKVVRLAVLKVNTGAKKLYDSLGFEVYGEGNEHWKMKLKK